MIGNGKKSQAVNISAGGSVDVGAMAVGDQASAMQLNISGEARAEQLAPVFEAMTQALAQFAYEKQLQPAQIQMLAEDIKTIREAVTADEVDKETFDRTANRFWDKLMMVGSDVGSVMALGEGIKKIASVCGWGISLAML
jgi:hypothetical protein